MVVIITVCDQPVWDAVGWLGVVWRGVLVRHALDLIDGAESFPVVSTQPFIIR